MKRKAWKGLLSLSACLLLSTCGEVASLISAVITLFSPGLLKFGVQQTHLEGV